MILEVLGGVLLQVGWGSGGHREGRGLEEDVGVDDRVGEGVEVADGVEVALVGDASSIVLEKREGAFGDRAGFIDLLKV